MIEIKQLPLGPLQTNCYLLIKDKTCLIIDPGNEGEKLISFLAAEHLKPLAILLTHSHYDHIGAVDVLRDQYNVDVYIHENEADWLGNPALNGSQAFGFSSVVNKADIYFKTEEQLQIGEFKFTVLETPGHSPGGVSFYFKDNNFVITGDALFQGSIGRSDLRQGNHEQLINSIKTKLLVLEDDTKVLPGHGPTTTIGYERQHNPFIQ